MKTKIILSVVIGIIVIAGIAFWYETRPLPVSNVDINTQVNHLNTTPTTETGTQSVKTLHIVGAESQAQFSLNEVLAGKPTFVVGTTNQVAGDIQVDNTISPAKITIGQIKIDAGSLKTDSSERNGAIQRFILKTNKAGNEYITFNPTSIVGVPDKIQEGQAFNYQITGDLTVDGTTKPVTFDAISTLGADGSFTGSANTTITYGDFNVFVPNLSFLANVDKTTKLSISIVAR